MCIPTCHLASWNGAPTLHVNGVPIPSVAYFCPEPTPERLDAMQRAGVRIITWGVGGATAHASDTGWRGGDTFDFQHLDEAARLILTHIPDAWLIPRIAATAPEWWMRENPEEIAKLHNGNTVGPGTGMSPAWSDDPRTMTVSQASDRWQADCERALTKLVEHIDASDWGERCIGLQPNGGVNEWFVGHGQVWTDYSDLNLNAFRTFLLHQGIEDAETAQIPTPSELKTGSVGGWNDPSVDRMNELWWRFYHGLNARRMIETCTAVKRASQNRLIVGGFYGYIGDSYTNPVPAAWLYGHHHPLAEVTEHPAVDFLAAPFSYQNRQPGGTPESQIPTASCDLAGCFTFTENDLGTFWSVRDESETGIRKSDGTMIRDQGQRIIRRQGFWWMDLLRIDSAWPGDWYTHPHLEELILKLTTLQAQEAAQPPSQWKAQVAVVLGNDTPFHTKAGHPILAEWVTAPLRNVLPAIGTPMDVLVLEDLAREDLPDYKLFVFLDVPAVRPDQRDVIHRVLTERSATAYFQGIPGLIDGTGMDVANSSMLTGIHLNLLGGGAQGGQGRRGTARFTDFDHPYLKDVSPSHTMGGYPSDVICFVGDPEARILATQSLKGRPSVAVKDQPGGWRSVYSSFSGAPAAFFRNLAREAGVHVFTDRDAVVDACDRLLLVHQVGPGPVTVALHQSWERAQDVITGTSWPVDNGYLLLDGPHGTTHFLSEAPETL